MTRGRKTILAAGAVLILAGGFYGKTVYEERWMPPGPPEVAGRILMDRKSCFRCHRIAGKGGEVGPDLTVIGRKEPRGKLDAILVNPRSVHPEGRMPRPKLTGEQRAAVVAYLMTLDGSGRAFAPDPAGTGGP